MSRYKTSSLALGVILLVAACAGKTKPSKGDAVKLSAQVEALASKAIAEGPVAAYSIAIAKGDTIVHEQAYGYESLEPRVPASSQSAYRIGSVTKQFTAVAILQLVEQGGLSLDAAIVDVLPSYPAIAKEVKVRHLLSHTSGIKNYTELEGWRQGVRARKTTEEMLELFQDLPLEFNPGEKFSYSNSGYFLLGVIIEKVGKVSYAEYIKEHLFAPAGMLHSRYCSDTDEALHEVLGYKKNGPALHRSDPLSMSQSFSAGAICSSAGDQVRWRKALNNDTLISAASRALMESKGTLNSGASTGYGFGLFVGEQGEHSVLNHGGSISGFSADTSYYPEDKLTIAVLSNTEGANTSDMEKTLAHLMLGLPLLSVKEVQLSNEDAAGYVGEYKNARVGGFSVARKDGQLVGGFSVARKDDQLAGGPEGAPALPLLYQGGHLFIPDFRGEGGTNNMNVRFQFVLGEGGVAERFELFQSRAETFIFLRER